MLKSIPFILFFLLSHQLWGQVDFNDSTTQRIIRELETRLPKSWQVAYSTDAIQLLYVKSDEIYAQGCCPPRIDIPKEKKLLKWLRNDYLTEFNPTFFKITDTLKVEVTFSPTWGKEKIDSVKIAQDSINLNLGYRKVEKCKNSYWRSTSSKQIIPFYAEKLDCSVFFDRPSAFGSIYRVDYQFDIPRFISIDDEILLVEQLAGLILGINERCFTCSCEED